MNSIRIRVSRLGLAAAMLCAIILGSECLAPLANAGGRAPIGAPKSKPRKLKAFKKAAFLVVAPKKKASAHSIGARLHTTGSKNALYIITGAGVMKEASYTDDKGKPYKMAENPIAIYAVNDTYLIVAFGYDASNIEDALLVRKTDGKLFSLKNAGWPVPILNYYKNDRQVKTDASGNIYYPTMKCGGNCTYSVVKVDVSNPAKLKAVKYLPPDDSVYGWDIDDLGDIIYSATVGGDSSNQVFRVRKATGALENVANASVGVPFWRGYDNAFYYYSYYSWSSGDPAGYKRLTLDTSGAMTREDYGATSTAVPGTPYQSYLFRFSNRVLTASASSGEVVEVNNPGAAPRVVSGLGLSTVVGAGQSAQFYYLAGTDADSNGVLLRVDPQTDAVTSLVPPGKYSFYNVAVSADDTVTYNALRMSDGVKVYGKIGVDGTDTLISAINTQAVDLEPIN